MNDFAPACEVIRHLKPINCRVEGCSLAEYFKGRPMTTILSAALKSFLFHCRYEKNLSDKTIKAYTIDLRQFRVFLNETCKEDASAMPVEKITKEILRDYIQSLFSGYKEKSIRRKVNVLKAFFNFLEREETLEKNPFRKMQIRIKEPRRLPRVIELGHIEKLLRHLYAKREVMASRSRPDAKGKGNKEAKDKRESRGQRGCRAKKEQEGAKSRARVRKFSEFVLLRDIVIVEFLFTTGARVSEICSLRAECVKVAEGEIKIMGKGQKERVAHLLTSRLGEILADFEEQREALFGGHEHYFINRLGKKISEQSVRFMLRKRFKAAGIDLHITPHMFRHTFATSLLEQGVDIRHIQEMLGHSSIVTTQIYTHVATAVKCKILADKHPRNLFRV